MTWEHIVVLIILTGCLAYISVSDKFDNWTFGERPMKECKRCHGTGHCYSGGTYHVCPSCKGKGKK